MLANGGLPALRWGDTSYRVDVSGNRLDPELIQAARIEDMQEAERMGVWRKVPRAVFLEAICNTPLGTMCVARDTGDDLHPSMRGRLAARLRKIDRV